MSVAEADVLVVGGGIAGWSAAWFAHRRGRRVTLVDEGVHRASDLPVALVNPLRGRDGRLVADGIDGMHASFALVDAMRERGHRIEAARGLHRPLIGVKPDALQRAWWDARIGGKLAFDWHDVAPSRLGLATPVPSLFLHDAGWLAPSGLLDALAAESAAARLADRVVDIGRQDEGWTVALAGGSRIAARTLLWCGGAWGAALLDRAAAAASDDALYKPGSLLVVDAPLTADALSFGFYAAPWHDGGTLVGPTREGSQSRFPEDGVTDAAIAHLAARVATLFGSTATPRAAWRGVRLARLSSSAAETLSGIPTLSALGSRGFLMAPLLAAAWARSL